jgi:homopolymeric O-antigen transport system permease protein
MHAHGKSILGNTSVSDVPVKVIQPHRGWVGFDLSQLWRSRELLYFLTWREIKVRYKQTALGAGWALIQPLLTMLVFSLFFGKLAKVPSDQIPYPLFCLAALVVWNFFSNGLVQSSNSLVESSNLISKVFFPRLTLPLSSVLAGLVDFAVSFVFLIVMMAVYHRAPPIQCLYVPLFVFLTLCNAIGAGLWLSALNVQYRDVRYVLPFLSQFWFYASPIAYPSSLISNRWRFLYGLNPMAGIIEGFRWSLLGSGGFPSGIIVVSSITTLCVLVSGAFFFRRMESSFADLV